jgi:hypothetical protein
VNGLNTKQNLISIPANAESPKGRIIFAADDDTTITYAPLTACRREGLSHKSKFPRQDAVLFSGSRITVCTAKAGVQVFCALYTLDGRLVARNEFHYAGSGTYVIDRIKTRPHAANAIFAATVTAGNVSVSGLLVVP